MKAPLHLTLALLLAPAVHAAPISWSVSSVSGPGDVSRAGAFAGALNVGGDSAQTINGITFMADPGGTSAIALGGSFAAAINFGFVPSSFDLWSGTTGPGSDAAYDAGLDSGRFSDAVQSGTVTLSGLGVGQTYLVQLWIVDTRGSGLNARLRNVKGAEAFATSTNSGGPNLASGVFTADATTQVITIADPNVSGHGPQLNLLQLRNLPSAASPGYLSNLSSSHLGHMSTAEQGFLAQAFDTGSVPAQLTGATVRLATFLGTIPAKMELWTSALSATVPATKVADLGLTTPFGNTNDVAYTVTGAAVENRPMLAANSRYWLVVSNPQPGGGSFFWRNTNQDNATSSAGATLPSVRANSLDDGASWSSFGTGNRQLFTLSTLLVTNTNDVGPGSLRQALHDAAALPGADTITFAPGLSGQTIALSSFSGSGGDATALVVNDSGGVTLDASALPSGLTIQRTNTGSTYRLFQVPDGSNLALIGLTLRDGGGAGYPGRGGAIENSGGTLTLTRCTLTGHQATTNGAISLLGGGSATLTHCTLSGNSAPGGFGGAIGSLNGLTLVHCTLSGNSAGSGGAIACSGSVNLTNTLIAGNTANGGAGNGPDMHNAGTLTRQGVNIVQHLANVGDGTVNGPGSILAEAAPLAPLGNYGGPVPTMPPLPGSPAIDATDESSVTDQRGLPIRDGDGNGSVLADIGAAEFQRIIVTTTADEDNTPASGGSGLSLREALRDDASGTTPAELITFAPGLSGQSIALTGVADAVNGNTALTVVPANGPITLDASALPGGLTLTRPAGASGDGYRAFRLAQFSSLTLRGLTLTGFTGQTGSAGGAILNNGTLTLTQCSLSGNSSSSGGAIYNGGTLTLTQCSLSGNSTSNSGGAIENGGTLTLTQCSLSGNATSGDGGAISNGSTLTLTQCSLSGNATSSNGGAIFNRSTLTLTNTLVGGNTATSSGPDIRNDSTLTRQGANIVQTAIAGPGIANGPGTISQADPLLAPLGNYGGPTPTPTLALLPGSPARNAAVDSTFTTDQRGFPIVGTADIGAYEVQSSNITLTSTDLSPAVGQSVTFTATVTEADPDVITPTGSVIFTVDNVAGSPVTLNGSGVATFTTSSLTAGPHTVTAAYSGDARLLTSTSSTVNLTAYDLSVGNANDSGSGSLRAALAAASTRPGPDTITLTSTQTVTLTSELLVNDTSPVTIDATGLANGFTVTDAGNVNHRLLHVQSGSTLTVKGVTFADGGGGVIVENGGGIYSTGKLTLDRCTVRACTGYRGGAIFALNSELTVDRCCLSGNQSTESGGGIQAQNTQLIVRQSTFSGNHAISGGAIYTAGGTMQMIQSTVAANTAVVRAGGLMLMEFNESSLTQSIVADNNASSAPDAFVSSITSIQLIGPNLIRTPIVNVTNSVTGPAPITSAPLLAPLGDYGGPTQTMPLLPGSPAIDQASVLNPALTTDQRGFPRPVGVRPDLGAVEGSVIVVTTPVDELAAPGNGVSLREAVRDVEAGGIITFDRAVFNSPSTNTITLTNGPLNPLRNCTLSGSQNPGGITIRHTLTITQQPLPLSVVSGATANFQVSVFILSGGLVHQWRKDGSDLAGQTSAALNLANVQPGDEALYDVTLGESVPPGTLTLINVNLTPASARSQPASLIVDGSPVTVQRGPASAMLALGSSHTLSVNAIGPAAPALTYQWRKNGVNLSGATKSSYLITNAQLSHAGAYTCVVKSGATSVTSTTAEIGVVDTRPKIVNLLATATASFTPAVSAAGNGLTYAWQRDATALPSTAKSFLIKPVVIGDAGLYTCTVTGLAGSITTGCNTRLNVSNAAPQFVLPLALPAAYIGQNYFYQLPVQTLAGAPATSFSIAGSLPSGMAFSKTTGVLSGRPTTTKTAGYALSFKAINPSGSSAAAPATLAVNSVPPTAVGVFAGPMARSSLNDNLGGRFDLTTTATGTFSGGITLGARKKLSFTAKLLHSAGSGDVILYGSIPNITLADKTVLIAYVEVFATDQRAVLTLVHPTNGTTVLTSAWRNPWLLSKTVALNKPATDYAAYYTARLDAGQGGAVSPDGYGYASFTISTAGTLTLAGKLPDGSAVSGGTHVGPNGEVMLFNLLHGNRGSHVGRLDIAKATPVANNTLTGTTSWFKPAPLTATSTDTVYKNGFGPLNVTAEGSVYQPPTTAGSLVMGLPVVAPGVSNAKISFSEGGIATLNAFSQSLRFTTKTTRDAISVVGVLPPLTNSTTMTAIDGQKGTFSGSFTMPGATAALNRPAPFYGQIIKISSTPEGYGYFLLPKVPVPPEKATTSPKQSGRVVLGLP